MNERSSKKAIIWLIIAAVLLFIISICVGQYKLRLVEAMQDIVVYLKGESDHLSTAASVIVNIRLPRSIAAIFIGGALSLSGLTYQSIFRNRLASPDLLGVSTGCCVGAASAILLDLNAVQIQVLAFAVGLFTVLITYGVSYLFRNEHGFSLILSGILVGGGMGSVLGILKYVANAETQLPSIIYWTMGDISSISLNQLSYVMIPIVVCTIILNFFSWRLNFFSVDEAVAELMGVDIKTLKIICIFCATLLTASAVSVAGTISWIGLAMPQAVRLLCGENTKRTVLTSFLAGIVFLLIADIIGRLISTAEIPMSILTGVPGVIVFIICIVLSNGRK